MNTDIQEKGFDTGKVALNYATSSSSGTPLVLLHGGSARWQDFNSILPDLASDFRVYAPDFRGHGKSDWAPNTYRLQDYTDDIIAFAQKQLTEPACLFGHSLGGIVALMVAAQYPAAVRAVAVGDAPLSSKTWYEHLSLSRDRVEAWRELAGGQQPLPVVIERLKDSPFEVPGQNEPIALRQVMGENSPVFEWIATNLYKNDPDMISAVLERFETTAAGYEMDIVLPAIQCPVLLMQADPSAGGLMTDREVAQALPLLAQPQHVKLSGVSHVLHNNRKELVLAELEAFYETC